MIGVCARAEEHRWVREFFELFKTPWEFFRAGADYDVVLVADDSHPATDARLVLNYGSAVMEVEHALDLRRDVVRTGAFIEQTGHRIPVYGACVTFSGGQTVEARISDGGEAVAIGRSREGQRVVRVGFDLFQEVRHLLTLGQPPVNARTPTLDCHIEMLRRWIVSSGVRLVEIPPVPAGFRFTACLTHDVDHPELRRHRFDHTALGFLKRAILGSVAQVAQGRMTLGGLGQNWLAAAKLPLVYLGWAQDFWRQTGRYLELERGLGSTFFVVPVKHTPGREVNRPNAALRATQYEAADIAKDLGAITEAGGEVGAHGMDAWLDAESGQGEAARVAAAAGQNCPGVRMHWLCFNEQSPAVLEAAGFDYDSTVGYNECAGYRAGTLQVYRPEGAERLLELPLHVMDTALFYPAYLNLFPSAAETLVEGLLDDARQFGGVLTINWHDRSLAPERLWGGFYEWLLERLRSEGAWCPTASQAVAWFRCRRSATFQQNPDGGVTLRMAGVSSPRTDKLPKFCVRIHNCPRGGTSVAGVTELEVPAGFEGLLPVPEAGKVP